MLTELKQQEDYAWLNEVSCVPPQQALRHLARAFDLDGPRLVLASFAETGNPTREGVHPLGKPMGRMSIAYLKYHSLGTTNLPLAPADVLRIDQGEIGYSAQPFFKANLQFKRRKTRSKATMPA
jgi:hypothetical protein